MSKREGVRVREYLFLFPELHLHLLVAWLVLANAVASDEVAADVGQLWVLLAGLFDEADDRTGSSKKSER